MAARRPGYCVRDLGLTCTGNLYSGLATHRHNTHDDFSHIFSWQAGLVNTMTTETIQAPTAQTARSQAQVQSKSSIPSPVPPQPHPPTASSQTECGLLPSYSASTSFPQATTSPQMPTASPFLASTPRNLRQRVSDKLGLWITIALGIATIVVAVYYGAVMLSYAEWTKHNDFREGCINDREHDLLLSADCSEELLRSRVSFVKRELEAAHGICRPPNPFDNTDDDRLRACPRICPRVCDRVCHLRHLQFAIEDLEEHLSEGDEVLQYFTSCSC